MSLVLIDGFCSQINSLEESKDSLGCGLKFEVHGLVRTWGLYLVLHWSRWLLWGLVSGGALYISTWLNMNIFGVILVNMYRLKQITGTKWGCRKKGDSLAFIWSTGLNIVNMERFKTCVHVSFKRLITGIIYSHTKYSSNFNINVHL